MKKIKVLIADDHLIVRMGLKAVLAFDSEIEVLAEVEDGAQAVEQALKLHPDVIIMDLQMPVLDGIEATEKINAALPSSKILILTTFEDPEDIHRAFAAGASGALLKNGSRSELIEAIHAVHGGRRFITAELDRQLPETPSPPPLTDRQKEILDSVTRGLTNKDIARMLNISPSGVKAHLSAIFEKIGAADRAEAVAIALRRHLLKK